MNKKHFVFLALLISTQLFAQSVDDQILQHTYNYNFVVADSLIEAQLAKHPNTPKYYYFKIGTELIKNIYKSDATHIKQRRALKDSLNTILIDYTENIIEKFEDEDELNLEDKFYLGCLYGYLGRFYGVQRSWMSAFSDAKEGQAMLEEVIEEDPKFYDAYLLLGMMNYYADRMGGFMGFVAGILGLSGDREKGLEYIKLSESKGGVTSTQATMLLGELYSRLESNNFESIIYLKKFTEQFPNNGHFKNWYCNELLNLGLVEEVGLVVNNDSEKVLNDYVLMRFYHLKGEYKKSDEFGKSFIENDHLYWHWHSNPGYFVYVLNSMMLDKPVEETVIAKLNKSYKSAYDLINRNPEDAKFLIEFRSKVSRNENKSELEEIIKNHKGISDKYLQAFFEFNAGVFFHKNKNYKSAEEYFVKASKTHRKGFAYNSIKYLINIYKHTNAKKQNVEYLVDAIDEYEYEALEYSARDLEEKYDL